MDSQISVPDLVPDFDFFSTVTREEFEKECGDLLARAVAPVQQALRSANVAPEQIDFVEVIGGGSRVPSIHSAIAKFLNREDVDRHLNGDEAAVFGASFFAATQSTSFRVKNDILLKDATAYGISEPSLSPAPSLYLSLFPLYLCMCVCVCVSVCLSVCLLASSRFTLFFKTRHPINF